MRFNRITLSFPEKEEKLFSRDYYFNSIFQLRVAFILLIFLYGIFGYLDSLLFPEYSRIFHIIRFNFVIPLFSAVFILSYTKVFQKIWQMLLFISFIVAGTGIIIMIMYVSDNFAYYGGLMLVFSAGYFFIKLRFFLASIAGWTTLLIFNVGALFYVSIPNVILINYNFFFISANIIGMFASYNIEYYARRNFLLNLELDKKKLAVEEINKNLEKIVKERTTELLLAKETAEESQAKLSNIVSNIDDAIWVLTWPDLKLIYHNDNLEKVFGRKPEEFASDNNLWRKITHPDDIKSNKVELEELTKKSKIEQEYRIIRPDGKITWIHDRISLIFNNEAKPIKVQGIAKDITDSKLAELRVLEAERLSAIGELASGIAHDFNNALQGILGNLELALIDNITPKIKKFIETAKKSTQDAASRVSKIQRFANKQTVQKEYETIDLKHIIEDSLAQTRTLWKDDAQKDGLTFNIRNHYEDLIFVRGNRGELRSVLFNILKNSIQAMRQGGTIDIYTRSEKEKAYLTIVDTGIGMDEETSKKIFQPFFTTKGYEQGKGIGLSGSYTIIKEHKGSIYVKSSKPGQGTEIELMLPCCEPEKKKEEKKNNLSGVVKILWVDDEEIVRNVGVMMASTLGHEVDVASSGLEALELLANKEYDLLITDIGMPNMSGWQLTEKIKGKYHKLVIAVVTGWGDNVEAEQKTKFGVEYVLGKPIDLEKLETLISEILYRKTSCPEKT